MLIRKKNLLKRLIDRQNLFLKLVFFVKQFFKACLRMDTMSSDQVLSKLLTDMQKCGEDIKELNGRLDSYDEILKVSL
jgi:hypothetical protein